MFSLFSSDGLYYYHSHNVETRMEHESNNLPQPILVNVVQYKYYTCCRDGQGQLNWLR